MTSALWNSPSRNGDAARSIVSATCSHPRAGGDKGLLRVTSSRWEKSLLQGSGFPLTNSPWPRWNCSSTWSRSSNAPIPCHPFVGRPYKRRDQIRVVRGRLPRPPLHRKPVRDVLEVRNEPDDPAKQRDRHTLLCRRSNIGPGGVVETVSGARRRMSSLNVNRRWRTKQKGGPGSSPLPTGRENSYSLTTGRKHCWSMKRSCSFGSIGDGVLMSRQLNGNRGRTADRVGDDPVGPARDPITTVGSESIRRTGASHEGTVAWARMT
jgi:hypothetical protein